jgi:hypothetical protein
MFTSVSKVLSSSGMRLSAKLLSKVDNKRALVDIDCCVWGTKEYRGKIPLMTPLLLMDATYKPGWCYIL